MAKIEFSEKELEDYLCEGGKRGNLFKHLGLYFLGRQIRMNVGIIDILAYHPESKTYFIVELKKENLNYDAYFQVEKYRVHFDFHKNNGSRKFKSLLIGNELDIKLIHSVFDFSEIQSSLSDYFNVFYRVFNINFENGIDFNNWYSPNQRKAMEDIFNGNF